MSRICQVFLHKCGVEDRQKRRHGRIRVWLAARLQAYWSLILAFLAEAGNTARHDAYTVASLRPGYAHRVAGRAVASFSGLHSLFDKRYHSTVRINAVANCFCEPAPGFNVYGEMSVACR